MQSSYNNSKVCRSQTNACLSFVQWLRRYFSRFCFPALIILIILTFMTIVFCVSLFFQLINKKRNCVWIKGDCTIIAKRSELIGKIVLGLPSTRSIFEFWHLYDYATRNCWLWYFFVEIWKKLNSHFAGITNAWCNVFLMPFIKY